MVAVTPDDERLQVLKMIEEGKVSAQEGLELLQAVAHGDDDRAGEDEGRWLRVQVEQAGEQKVDLNLPVSLVGVIARFVPRQMLVRGDEPIDVAALVREIQRGARGKLVDVRDGEDRVSIFVE